MKCNQCQNEFGHSAQCTSDCDYVPPAFADGFMVLDLRLRSIKRTRLDLQRWLDHHERQRKEKAK